jgi:hypothetical protein
MYAEDVQISARLACIASSMESMIDLPLKPKYL